MSSLAPDDSVYMHEWGAYVPVNYLTAPLPPPMPQPRRHPDADEIERLEELLSHVHYRWADFSVSSIDFACRPYVLCERYVDDARAKSPTLSGMVKFRQQQEVPPGLSLEPENFYRWLFFKVIMPMERHEAGEWFVVDGQRPFDEHPPAPVPPQDVNFIIPR